MNETSILSTDCDWYASRLRESATFYEILNVRSTFLYSSFFILAISLHTIALIFGYCN